MLFRSVLQAVRALQTPSVWQAAAAAALQAASVLFTFDADPDGDLVLVAACPGCPGRGMLTVAKGGAYRCTAGCGVSGTDALLSALVRHLEAGAGGQP